VSRSQGSDDDSFEPIGPQNGEAHQVIARRSRHDDVEFNEIDVRVRISYKTLLLIFVLFDVFHKVVTTVSESDFVQSLL